MKPAGLIAALGLLAGAGCGPRQSAAGLAGIPPEGHVRILAKKLRDDGRSYQFQWTIVGDRNWRVADGDGWRFRLSNTYPLNSTSNRGGTHIWEFTATVAPPPGGQATSGLQRDFRLRGSNAGQFRSTGSVGPAGVSLGQVVRTLQTRDALLSIPATVHLVRVGGETVELRIER
jgi:hypothetical protein